MDRLVTEEDAGGLNRLIRATELIAANSSADSARTYYHYASDEMGSTTHITDEDGKVLNRYAYDAFGNLTEQVETIPNRFKFTGQQLDPVTQQYYLRARFYNPVIARFTQEDTYRGDGLNLYIYCSSNPVYYVDPSGYATTNPVGYANVTPSYLSRSGGRYGNTSTRQLNVLIANAFGAEGQSLDPSIGSISQTYGGNVGKERYFPSLTGGRKGGSYSDLTFSINDNTLTSSPLEVNVNTISSNPSTELIRELQNASRINSQISQQNNLVQPPIILIDKDTYEIISGKCTYIDPTTKQSVTVDIPDPFSVSWGSDRIDESKMNILNSLQQMATEKKAGKDAAQQISDYVAAKQNANLSTTDQGDDRGYTNPRANCP